MANPFRPVSSPASSKESILYDDVQSARSAILSGSARNRNGPARGLASSSPRDSIDVALEHDSIPLKIMKSGGLPRPSLQKASDNLARSSLRNASDSLPHPSLLRKVSNQRRVQIDTEPLQFGSASNEESSTTNRGAPKALASTSIHQNARVAQPSTSSPLARQGETLEHGNGAYIKQEGYTEGGSSMDSSSGQYSTPALREGQSTVGNIYKLYIKQEGYTEGGSSMDSSSGQYSIPALREGHSTVGNIYKLYARLGREDVQAENPKAPGGPMTEKLMAAGTPAPTFPLPSLPGLEEVPLDDVRTPRQEPSAIFSDAGQSTVNSLPTFSPRNPFRARSRSNGRNRSRNGEQENRRSAVVSFADDSHCVYDNNPEAEDAYERLPLERQVSDALRRASGFSFYSMASVSSSILGPGQRYLDQGSNGPSVAQYSSRPHNQHKQRGLLAVDSSMHGPIFYHGSGPDSPPYSPAPHLQQPPRHSDPQSAAIEATNSRHATSDDDWETVGESAFGGLDGRQSREFIPAMFGKYGHYGDNSIQRAGSSIANTSDAGSLTTTIPEVEYINTSTDRIAQHPARIEYSNDYRLRELKNTNMPVLLPSYNDHKVNGYLANSSRVVPNPSSWFHTELKPMKNPHRHPFNTTPPEVAATARPKMPKSDKKKANHFPRLSKVMKEEDMEASSSDNGQSTWAYPRAYANGAALPGSQENSKNNSVNTKQAAIMGGDGAQTDESTATSGQERSLHERLDRRPMVQGPPGAFYQGLRADGKTRKVRGPHQDLTPNRIPSRHNIKDYPTNELRPLSLSLRYDPTGMTRSLSQSSAFNVYRSPLSPPQRQTWRDLYTESQLEAIDRSAERSQFDRRRTEEWLNSSMKKSTMEDMVPRNFFAAPTLHSTVRNSMPGSMRTTKDSVSIGVLFVCAFFPPLLAFYLLGYLNGVMKWATGGECSSYTDKGRKIAKALLLCWMFAAIVGLIVFICWWTIIRKRH